MGQGTGELLKSCPHGSVCAERQGVCAGVWHRVNRRDSSPVGQRRRLLFTKLQAVLETEGLAAAAAREAVFNTLKGRAAETIELTEGAGLLWRLLDGRMRNEE